MYGETGGPVIIGPRGEIIRESEEVAKARDEARREEERARDEAARLAALERRSRKIANNPARVLELAATKALCELRCLQDQNAADESALEDYTVALRQAGAQAAGGGLIGGYKGGPVGALVGIGIGLGTGVMNALLAYSRALARNALRYKDCLARCHRDFEQGIDNLPE